MHNFNSKKIKNVEKTQVILIDYEIRDFELHTLFLLSNVWFLANNESQENLQILDAKKLAILDNCVAAVKGN
jgi:hypothetical protein